MRLDERYEPYLRGERFANTLRVAVSSRGSSIHTRFEYLESRVRGKRVIHVGCLDHLPLIEERIKENTWLHKRLTDSASECLGIDINAEGAEIAKRHGFDNIVISDIIRDEAHPRIRGGRWDYMILAEVLEHIDNPVEFLRNVRQKYGGLVDRFIVTVPNAFHLRNFTGALRGVEEINSDHRYWFTPYTLAKLATRAGFGVIDCMLFLHRKKPISLRRYMRIFGWPLQRMFPLLRPCLIMELGTGQGTAPR